MKIKVVQQSIRDASEGLAKQDMAQYARDISSGGESAFGSRARLSAEERAEAMGRGVWLKKLAESAQQAFRERSRRLSEKMSVPDKLKEPRHLAWRPWQGKSLALSAV
jgi:hypothetical protein